MDYKQLASDIIRLVGTESNIKSVTHCMTRLRFILNDVSKADKEALQNLKGVLGVVYNGGQYMVILGQNLLPVYESVVKDHNIAADEPIDENLDGNQEKEPWSIKRVGAEILGYVSASVSYLIPGLVAGGMLKVVLLLIVNFISPDFASTTSYALLSAIADAPFFFMPIFVAYGAATKLGGTPIYAMAASAALLHGNFTSLVAAGDPITLFGLSVRSMSYGTSLLPALLIALAAYYAEKFFNKIVPGIFRSILVGLGTIFIAGSLGYLILGPIGNIIGGWIAAVFMFLSTTVGPLAVGLLAAALPWLVMGGMHMALVPFMTQLLSNPGYDAMIRPAFILHNMAEGGAVLGVAARTKDKEFRSECISVAIGCIVAGVSEPAIYGINVRYKKPMYGVMAGGLAGGIVAGIFGVKAYVMGYSNMLALPIFEETAVFMLIAMVISIVVAAIVTFILGIEEETASVSEKKTEEKSEEPAAVEEKKDDEITAVADGKMIAIENVKDEAFASKAMGDGVAFELASDYVCAPANGEVAMIFPTGHAFGITAASGKEFLVHIGIDTVALKGEGFKTLVNQGDVVKAGQPIVKVDRDFIKSKGYDLTTMLIITDDNGMETKFKNISDVTRGTTINE